MSSEQQGCDLLGEIGAGTWQVRIKDIERFIHLCGNLGLHMLAL